MMTGSPWHSHPPEKSQGGLSFSFLPSTHLQAPGWDGVAFPLAPIAVSHCSCWWDQDQ